MNSISRRLWMVLFLTFFVFALSIKTNAEVTIVVSGHDPKEGINSGIFDMCASPTNPNGIGCQPILLPLGDPLNPLKSLDYSQEEKDVNDLTIKALGEMEGINMVGYSHGATLVLKVANSLSKSKNPLVCIDRMVTLDRVSFLYPFPGQTKSLPKNVWKALNIYQTLGSKKTDFLTSGALCPLDIFGLIKFPAPKPLYGTPLTGAENEDVTAQVLSFWNGLPEGQRPECLHWWMEKDPNVQMLITSFLSEPAGILGNWDVTIDGTLCASGLGCQDISQGASITFSANMAYKDEGYDGDYIDVGYGASIGKWVRTNCNKIQVDYNKELLASLQKQTCLAMGYDCDYNITKAYAVYTHLQNSDQMWAVSFWQGDLTIYDGVGGILYKGRVTAKGKGTASLGSASTYSFDQEYIEARGPVTSIIGPVIILP